MHTIAVLAVDDVVPFDLATPIDVFSRARLPDGRAAYRVVVCAPTPEVDAGTFTLRARYGLEALADADTVVVPGTHGFFGPTAGPVLDALRDAAAQGVRIASICSGAFLLAEAGLLDGLRATTHWIGTADLAARYPEVRVDPDVLYIDNGLILTSAGAAAALDLCLYMIRRDYGAAVAADAARMSVVALEREGGQAQFIAYPLPPVPAGATLEPLLDWMAENCGRDLTLADIAAHAGTSARTLNRRFRDQLGTTPLQWLHRTRVHRAQHLLETTEQPVERIAVRAGFGSPTAFRDRFRRVVGISPQAYRRSFRSGTPHAGAAG